MNNVIVEMMKVITASDRWGSNGKKFNLDRFATLGLMYNRQKIFTAKLLQQPITSCGSINDDDLHLKLDHKDNRLTVEEDNKTVINDSSQKCSIYFVRGAHSEQGLIRRLQGPVP